MSIKKFTCAFLILAFVSCGANVFSQTYISPPVQSVPVGQMTLENGQVFPAGGTYTREEGFPAAEVIPVYPGSTPGTITVPQVPSSSVPSVQVPWTQDLVRDVQTNHDFGSVPTGSQQEHTFEFVNTSDAPLNLISVRASCGCTKPTVLTSLVQPGETAKVMARFDTMQFRGEKAATVTVGINKLSAFAEYGEVQLSVKGKIRKDVVLTPGNISFDNVPVKSASQQTVKMKYAGNPLWQILRVESTNTNIKAEARELKREGGRITYELVVKLSGSQPTGTFADELYVITNDKLVNKMPITVAGRVKPTLEAASIKLGMVKQGVKVEKRFVIRGEQPFEIQEVRVSNKFISFVPPIGKKSFHVLKYSLDTSTVGQINDTITVVTSDPDNSEKTVEFSARIVPEFIAEN